MYNPTSELVQWLGNSENDYLPLIYDSYNHSMCSDRWHAVEALNIVRERKSCSVMWQTQQCPGVNVINGQFTKIVNPHFADPSPH